MSSALYALGRRAFRARRIVLLVWIGILAVLFTGAGLLSVGTDNTYTIPGTESQEALDSLARTFPQVSGSSAQLVAVAPPGASVQDPAFESAVTDAASSIAQIPQVTSATSPYTSASSANIAADDSAVIVPIQLSVGTTSVLPATSEALQQSGSDLQTALPDGSQVAVGGQLFSQDAAGISITELLGIAIAFVVLFLTLGSLIAAGLPLITALLGVGASLSLVMMATPVITVTSTTPLLALMLGLAVGIDYGLFILARHQDQVRDGMEPEESAALAVATSGSAVAFAAITVIIALLGLAVAGIPFLTTMGVAAALAVAMAVCISLTLTPALLGFAGWRIVQKRYRPSPAGAATADADEDAEPVEQDDDDAETAPPPAPAPAGPGFFGHWVRVVTRWPIVSIVLIVAALGALAVPAMHLRLALPDAGSLDEHAPGRIAYDLVAEHFGPGYNGPLLVTGSVIESTDPVGLMDDLSAEIATVPGVASVPLSTPNETGDTGIVQVIPEGAPSSEATKDLVVVLRSMHDHFEREFGVDLSVTGYTAAGVDISDRLAGALLPFGLLVVGLSLVLLAMVFRSIVVPVTAALGFVLSVGAAFGITTLVFVDGFLAGPLNVAAVGSAVSFMPIILMGVLFGLAMDYEVFLVSRMREAYVHSEASPDRATRAVHDGFATSGRVVTAAALIMFAVFAAFVPEGDANIQPIALSLAVGVVIDAFVVRMALIPAVLVLFGDRTWKMPAWLDRVLPSFDVEGEGIAEELALADWPPEEAELVIAGDDVRTSFTPAGATGAEIRLGAGEVLVVTGGDAAERTALLLSLGGRAPATAERLKVRGLVLAVRAAAVRAQSAYVSVRGTDAVTTLAGAVAGHPPLLMIDGLDALGDPVEHAGVRHALTATGAALVIAARDRVSVADMLPAASVVRALELAAPAPAALATER
ncbi:MAG TPA: MMPL family transporter [Microbacterium sp.]|nr:MMPL family transporter [Microbacterium sp.]